jgi:serine/threonine protein phosphatase 1
VATVCVGDVHGNLAALEDLLNQLLPELQSTDTLVFLGDYIDRGPHSRGVLDRLVALRTSPPCHLVFLLGNHEQWMLKTRTDFTSHSWLLGMEAFATIGSYSTDAALILRAAASGAGSRLYTDNIALPYDLFFNELPPSHVDLLEHLQPFWRTADSICVHGGVPLDDTPVEKADVRDLVWGSYGFPDSYRGTDLIVYGHRNDCPMDDDGWPSIRRGERTVGIDSIACGVLTAIRLPDFKVFQSGRHA